MDGEGDFFVTDEGWLLVAETEAELNDLFRRVPPSHRLDSTDCGVVLRVDFDLDGLLLDLKSEAGERANLVDFANCALDLHREGHIDLTSPTAGQLGACADAMTFGDTLGLVGARRVHKAIDQVFGAIFGFPSSSSPGRERHRLNGC